MTVTTDPLADEYLRRLDAAASALPAHRRQELVSEIRDHLQEGLRQARQVTRRPCVTCWSGSGHPKRSSPPPPTQPRPTSSSPPTGRPTVPRSYRWCWACC